MHHDERIIPDKTEKGILSIHLKRFDFAREHCAGVPVLDLGCGTGYGSDYLAEKASKVMGVDIDIVSIRYAREHYRRANLDFLSANAESLPLPSAIYAVICSFEIVEHVGDVEKYFSEVKRLMVPEGIFFISTPLAAVSTDKPANPYHLREWGHPDFEDLLKTHFDDVKLYWQTRRQSGLHRWLQKADVFNLRRLLVPPAAARIAARATGSASFADLDMNDLDILPVFSKEALSQIAVCRGPR